MYHILHRMGIAKGGPYRAHPNVGCALPIEIEDLIELKYSIKAVKSLPSFKTLAMPPVHQDNHRNY